ncbi:MAG: hypothetical protein AB8G22_17635 [Saprospiraceae bacterium]
MLLQTGLLQQLAADGKRIAIIAPDAQDPKLLALQKNAAIEVFEAAADTNFWGDEYLFKRKYFLENIKANPALWEKHMQAVFYNPSRHPWRRIRPFWYYLIFQLVQIFPQLRQRFLKKEKRYLQSTSVAQLIEKINPALVISTYPVNLLEAKVLYAAQQQAIPTVIHLLSWDNITSKGKFPVSADYYLVWGEVMRKELVEYYQPAAERIYSVGVPHFDHHLAVKKQPAVGELLTNLGLNPQEPYLFMAMSSPYFAPKEIDIAERLAEWIEQDVFGKKMQLVVRPHPQNVSGFMADKSWLPRLKQLPSTRVAVDYPQLANSKLRWSMAQSDMDHLSNLLIGCSVCLNSGSTVSIDALVLDKPAILTSFDADASLSYWKSARRLIDYTHLKKFIEIGGATPVYAYDELIETINIYLKNPEYHADRRAYALEQQCFSNDGRATERAVAAMLDISTKTRASA